MKHDKENRFMQILDLINCYAETTEELEGLKANIDIMIENMKGKKNMKYYILCRRNGIESILKNNGVEQEFATLEQAQEKAKEMRKLVPSADYFVETNGVDYE